MTRVLYMIVNNLSSHNLFKLNVQIRWKPQYLLFHNLLIQCLLYNVKKTRVKKDKETEFVETLCKDVERGRRSDVVESA